MQSIKSNKKNEIIAALKEKGVEATTAFCCGWPLTNGDNVIIPGPIGRERWTEKFTLYLDEIKTDSGNFEHLFSFSRVSNG